VEFERCYYTCSQPPGSSGDGRLSGGAGYDRILAGPGRDASFARDRLRDFSDGGLGRDRARIDRRLDRARRVEAFF
jgi:hypothetical protein